MKTEMLSLRAFVKRFWVRQTGLKFILKTNRMDDK